MNPKNLILAPVQSQRMFTIYHDMRDRMLFKKFGKPYDKYHPDELNPNNHRRILLLDNEPIGTIREDLQKHGYESKLIKLAEEFAIDNGCSDVIFISGKESVGFWRKCGYLLENQDIPRIMKKSLTAEKQESLPYSACQKPANE